MVGSGDARGSIAPHSASRTPRVGSEGEEKRRMINLERVARTFCGANREQWHRRLKMIFLL